MCSLVEFSKKFSADILLKLRVKQKYTINRLVEMTDEVEEALKLLDIGSADVRFLGIYGMGGIGKTTLAKLIFNRISSSFDSCSFLGNVREDYNRKVLEYLQTKLFEDLNPKATDSKNTTDLVDRMERSLRMKRVLIVLDDVGERSHITELIGDSMSFGSRSRIIITTRDERVLMNVPQASSHDEGSAKVRITRMQIKGMNREQALKLFSRHAFGSDSPPEDYKSLSEDVVAISARLVVALKAIGSLLYGMSIGAWRDKIGELKSKIIPEGRVQEKLMISYKALKDDEKEIFLDIACYFVDKEKSNAIYMWEACSFHPNWAVPVLLAMSLVKITDDGKFWMHDQLRDLGREVVPTKGYNSPSSREGSRIQTYEDALCALERKKGKEVVGLRLDGSGNTRADFTSFENVRFLEVAGEATLRHRNFWRLPENLKWLSLSLNYRNLFATARSKFSAVLRNWNDSYLMKLAVLDLSRSTITDDWEGWVLIQRLRNLKVLDLTECWMLTRTPNFSEMVALEKLNLHFCRSLAKIDSSIGKLRKLKYLNLEYCVSLQELPEKVGNLEEVEQIIMTRTLVSKLPDSIGKMKKLEHLSLRESIKLNKLPESIVDLRSLVDLDNSGSEKLKELLADIGRLVKLEHLSLSHCDCVSKLPDSIGDLTSLVSLDLSDCRLIKELPSSITRLVKFQRLSLQGCGIVQIPDDFGNLESLVELNLTGTAMAVVPDSIGDLTRLKVVNLSGTPVRVLPETVAQLSRLQELNLSGCDHIEILPQLPTSLTNLQLRSSSLRQAPYLFEVVQLRMLILDDGWSGAYRGRLSMETFKFDAICDLSRLEDLDLVLESLTSLPAEFSTLTQLRFLRLRCPNLKCVPQFPSSLQTLVLEDFRVETELPCLSNLNNLSQLMIARCWIGGGIRSLGVERLESLTRLAVYWWVTIDTFPDLLQLKCLEELDVLGCDELVEIPGLGSLVSVERLEITECDSIEMLENMKNLTRLTEIAIENCKNLGGIRGFDFEELNQCKITIEGCKCTDIRR